MLERLDTSHEIVLLRKQLAFRAFALAFPFLETGDGVAVRRNQTLELGDTLVAGIQFCERLIAPGGRAGDVLPQPRRRGAFFLEPARELSMRDFTPRELRSELFEAALETRRFGRESLACLCFGERGRQRFRQATFGNTELVAVFGDFIVHREPAFLGTFDIGFELFDTCAKTIVRLASSS